VLVNLLNPKLTLLFPRVPAAVRPRVRGGGQLPMLLALSAVFVAMTFLVFAGYGVCASAVRRHLIDRSRIVRRVRQRTPPPSSC
jgi:threonine/homoserine/homoserine lactone efflux protein